MVPPSPLQSHSLSLPHPTSATRTLRILLLTPTSLLLGAHRALLLATIERLTALTAGVDILIVYLLAEPNRSGPSTEKGRRNPRRLDGVAGLMTLQTLSVALHPFPNLATPQLTPFPPNQSIQPLPTPHPAVLPLPTVSSLPQTLTSYTSSLAHPTPSPSRFQHRPTAYELLRLCTTGRLSEHGANVVTDLCDDLRGLVGAVREKEGRERVEEWVGGTEGKGVVEFWKGEWGAG
ncbi:MAG: hypothetical protein M1833_002623 [Piccolia ochrophora]|nr:MAG: hypothetical protein M1833_002623 [Piccolia ochrophora]